MVSEDSDLKQMFDAQRKIDEAIAPSFDDMQVKSHPSPADSTTATPFMPLPRYAATLVIASLALLVVFVFSNYPQRESRRVSSMEQVDEQRLNRLCDSLLVAIERLDSRSRPTVGQESKIQRMEWPTVTDSLIPFDTFSFNSRTIP